MRGGGGGGGEGGTHLSIFRHMFAVTAAPSRIVGLLSYVRVSVHDLHFIYCMLQPMSNLYVTT